MRLKFKKLNIDSPKQIDKKLGYAVADHSAERVYNNLKKKNVRC